MKNIVILFFFGLVLIALMSPLIISIWKDNFWYMFLFFVSWIPAKITAQLGSLIEELM